MTEEHTVADVDFPFCSPELSGKMLVLDGLLKTIRAQTNDKVVLVSNSTKISFISLIISFIIRFVSCRLSHCFALFFSLTSFPFSLFFFSVPSQHTLSLLEKMCAEHNYPFVRLDGSTQNDQRQRLVDHFNAKDSKHCKYPLITLSSPFTFTLHALTLSLSLSGLCSFACSSFFSLTFPCLFPAFSLSLSLSFSFLFLYFVCIVLLQFSFCSARKLVELVSIWWEQIV